MNHEIRNPQMDLDKLLHDFFRSEMPQPWPDVAELKIDLRSARAESVAPQRALPVNADVFTSNLYLRSSSRSRLVLAASVAILLIGSWWLGQRFSANSSDSSPSTSGKLIGQKQPGKSKSPRPSPASPVR
jgi:hypothetical protein